MQVSAVVTSVTLQVIPLERPLTKKCTLFYLTQTYRIYHWSQSHKWLVTDCFSTRTNSYHLNLTFTTRKTVVVFEHECISKSGRGLATLSTPYAVLFTVGSYTAVYQRNSLQQDIVHIRLNYRATHNSKITCTKIDNKLQT